LLGKGDIIWFFDYQNTRRKAKKEVVVEKEVVVDKPLTERQDLEQILGNENASIESMRVRYDYEPAAELAPAISNTLRADSTKNLVEKAAEDTFITGAVAGILGTLVLHLLSAIWEYLGLIGITTMQVSGEIFLIPSQVNTSAGFWVSIFTATQMRQDAVGVLFHIINYIAYGLAVSYILYRFANIREKRTSH